MAPEGIAAAFIGMASASSSFAAREGVFSSSRSDSEGGGGFLDFMRASMSGKDTADASVNGFRDVNRSSSGATKMESYSRDYADSSDSRLPQSNADDRALSPADREAMSRVKKLAEDGTLDSEQVKNASDDELQDLLDWVMAGANGMFAPYVDMENINIQDQAAFAMIVDAAGEIENAAGDMQNILAAMESLTDEERQALADALKNILTGSEGDGTAADGESPAGESLAALESMSGEELFDAIKEAIEKSGVDMPIDGASTEDLPDIVARSLAIKVLDAGREENGEDLLGQLENDKSLRESLKLAEAGQDEAVEEKTVGSKAEKILTEDTDAVEDEESDAKTDEVSARAGEGLDAESGEESYYEEDTSFEDSVLAGSESEKSDVNGEGDDVATAFDDTLSDTLVSGLGDVSSEQNSTVVESGSVQAIDGLAATRGVVNAQTPVDSAYADAARMAENIEKVENAMRLAVRRGMNHVSLQLSPPELGKVSINLEMKSGVMSATLRVESVEARNFLAADLNQLRQSLQVHGVELDSFDVNVGGENAEAGQDGRWNNSAKNGSSSGNGSENVDGEAVAVEAASASASVFADGSLNITV